MRAVFQLPASMTSVVDAPRAVSSDASPTRPLCAVTRASMPAARAAAVKRATGCPVIVNTSFNVRGEPIVCTPEDAYRCFMRTEMDVLVLEDCVLDKADQPAVTDDQDWRQTFELD